MGYRGGGGGHRHRRMLKLTGIPGWMRFGLASGEVDNITPYGQPPDRLWEANEPFTQITPPISEEQESQMLEQQVDFLKRQLEQLEARLKELSEEGI